MVWTLSQVQTESAVNLSSVLISLIAYFLILRIKFWDYDDRLDCDDRLDYDDKLDCLNVGDFKLEES